MAAFLFNKRIRCEYTIVKTSIQKNQREIDKTLITLLTAAEDHRYMDHFGFDPFAILRATIQILAYQRLEGASTIEQQLVRTITNKRDISIKRKIEEIILSTLISLKITKNEIAISYLSLAYFGHNCQCHITAYGALNALELLSECDISNGAAVVALLKRPMPITINESWKELHRTRQNHIIRRFMSLY